MSGSEATDDYWLEHYVRNGKCTLCDNKGIMQTKDGPTYCICPNGQAKEAEPDPHELSKSTG